MTDERPENRDPAAPSDYFKKRPFAEPGLQGQANSQSPAGPAPSLTPAQDQEFLSNYMTKLDREQKIIKAQNSGIIYYPVGSIKFALLCLFVPFQGYFVWWLYKNFVSQKERNKNFKSPLWRLNLLLLYLRGLLNSMRDEGKLYGIEGDLNVEKIIFYAVMLLLCGILPEPASMFGMLAFVPFIYVNEYLIKLNKVANPDLPISSKLSFGEWLLLLLGVSFFIFKTFLLPQVLTGLTDQLTHRIGI